MDNSYSKYFRLRSSKDFSHVRQNALFASSGLFLFFYKKSLNDSGATRIGLSISGKICGAVDRNFIKRRVRETFRNSEYKLLNKDVVVVLNKKKFHSMEEAKKVISTDLLSGLKKIANS